MSLKKKQLDDLKEKLVQERSRILKHLEEIEGDSKEDLGQVGGDEADMAALEVAQRSLARLGGREKKLLRLIDHALAKFENNTYGICEYSGEEIPYKRLEISPWAKYTVEAKEELERQEKQFRKTSDDEDFEYEAEEES